MDNSGAACPGSATNSHGFSVLRVASKKRERPLQARRHLGEDVA